MVGLPYRLLVHIFFKYHGRLSLLTFVHFFSYYLLICWYRDSNSSHLVKANLSTLYIDLFESQSHTFNTMPENESVHDEHENQSLRTMREYLQPPLVHHVLSFLLMLIILYLSRV